MPLNGTPGLRTKLVTIQQVTDSKGPSGRPVETWTVLCQAWMEREDASLRPDMAEHYTTAQQFSRSDVIWRMPYQANMDPEVINVPKRRRLLYGGRVYDIVSATPIGQHAKIELTTMANTAVPA